MLVSVSDWMLGRKDCALPMSRLMAEIWDDAPANLGAARFLLWQPGKAAKDAVAIHPMLMYKPSDWGCVPLFKMAGGKGRHNLRLAPGCFASSGLYPMVCFRQAWFNRQEGFPTGSPHLSLRWEEWLEVVVTTLPSGNAASNAQQAV